MGILLVWPTTEAPHHHVWDQVVDMEVLHDARHKQDTASLAFSSDPLVGVAAVATMKDVARHDMLAYRVESNPS